MNPDFGLKIGTVVRPKPGGAGGAGAKPKDPNCVTVRILDGINSTATRPTYKEVTARVLASFAGSTSSKKVSYGSVIIPQDGEQVLVGYLDGNSQGEAYILGSVFQGTVKPPYDITKTKAPSDTAAAGESMVIKLKNKTQISINNTSPTDTLITIVTGSNKRCINLVDDGKNSYAQICDKTPAPETYMKIDFKSGTIECKAKQKMTFAAGKGDKGSIVIDGTSGNITIKSTAGSVVIDSTKGSKLGCGANNMFNASQAGAEVKGTQTKVEGSSMVNIKGASVKVGSIVQLG
ncbi:MAG: hypothetical protein Q4B93_02515 [Clostridia bacterium]|nr:hypothetical protein [Clostridia bacterium]